VAVHPDLDIPGLTLEQLKGIYTGKFTNWEQLGGPTLEIIPYSRSLEAGGTVQFFVQNILGGKFIWNATEAEIGNRDDVVKDFEKAIEEVKKTTDGINQVANNQGGIYYATAAQIVPQCRVKPLSLGRQQGIFATPYRNIPVSLTDCIQNRQKNQVNLDIEKNDIYPQELIRELYILIKEDGGIVQQAGEAYANLLLTEQGQQLIEEAELIRIRPPKANPKECPIRSDTSG